MMHVFIKGMKDSEERVSVLLVGFTSTRLTCSIINYSSEATGDLTTTRVCDSNT